MTNGTEKETDGAGSPAGGWRSRMPSLPVLAWFAGVWLMTGFAMGTATLLGPVRSVTGRMRASGASESAESLVVLAIIVVYVILSAVAAWWLVRRSRQGEGPLGRGWPPAAAAAAAGLALWLWFQPSILNRGATMETDAAGRFVFGPYPDAARLDSLQAAGFDGVISLLHPAVVPFEPALLEEERENVAAMDGFELVHAPMLPWVSENEESIATIRELIASGQGTWYVHCYLGRDRVGVVRRLVESATGEIQPSADFGNPQLAGEDDFERGPIFVAYSPVYITPYPLDYEFLSFYVDDRISQIVSLLDPENESDVRWIQQEEEWVQRYGVPYLNLPMESEPFDPRRALEVAGRIRTLPHPVAVHAFLTPSITTQAVRIALNSGLPPLPPMLFEERPLDGGLAEVLAPNVALGPTPTPEEAAGRLPNRGIRAFVIVDGTAPDVRAAVEAQGYTWIEAASDDPGLLERLSGGGPWYVFGPGSARVRDAIATRLGPVFRDAPR